MLSRDSDSSDSDGDDNSYISSGTSSYDSDHGPSNKKAPKNEASVVTTEEVKKQHADKALMEMLDEFEEPGISSYAKFKTQNEIDPE